MQDQPTSQALAAKPPRLFDALRVDPKKAADGVWIPPLPNGDRLKVRRFTSPEHARAYLQAAADYKAKHGEKAIETADGQANVEAVAMATGLIIGWEIKNQPDLPYDPAAMAAALVDPELADVRRHVVIHTSDTEPFRPDEAVGN
ncbi:MAG: hypothetical protein WAT39_24020 [Planctomycetota bacterium]